MDHDNSGVAATALFNPTSDYLFVALKASREVAVIDPYSHHELMRFNVGRAPQGLALSSDGSTLYVHNFMDRTVGVYDIEALVQMGDTRVGYIKTYGSVAVENLPAQVLRGKQLFYDARDPRLARDVERIIRRPLSHCSLVTCHSIWLQPRAAIQAGADRVLATAPKELARRAMRALALTVLP